MQWMGVLYEISKQVEMLCCLVFFQAKNWRIFYSFFTLDQAVNMILNIATQWSNILIYVKGDEDKKILSRVKM